MSTPRIEPLPEIPPEVGAARTDHLTAVVAGRGLCTDPVRYAHDPEYRDRWSPREPRGNAKRDRAVYLVRARAVCKGAGCTVVAECLEMTLRAESESGESHGISGATAPWERRELIAQRKQFAAQRAQRHNEQLAGVA
jgi:hypothetical protein